MIPAGLHEEGTQQELGEILGISQPRVSQYMTDGVIPKGSLIEQIQAYASWLREQAAGRGSAEAGGLDLVQERAALAREQRVSYEIKNAIARGEYAPIGLLADVLARAAAAVVDRFDSLPNVLRKACPDLPAEARDAIARVHASARNEWIRATSELVVKDLEGLTDDEPDAITEDMTE